MSAPYFETPEEAAEGLGIPLLGSASAATAVPRAARRLSALAPEAVLGARIYNRLGLAAEAPVETIWATSPEETLERLAWAVAVAEQAARAGRTAFLLDLDRPSALSAAVGGGGRSLPAPVLERVAPLAGGPVAAWSSDLQGVRVLLPVESVPTGETIDPPVRWSLVVVRALPAGAEETARIAAAVDAIILAVSIRDHDREKLEEIVRRLGRSESVSIGLIGLGPVGAPPAGSPLERWRKLPDPPAPPETETEPEEERAPAPVAAGHAASRAGGGRPIPRRRIWRNLLWILLFAGAVAVAGLIYSRTTILSVLEEAREEPSSAPPAGPPAEAPPEELAGPPAPAPAWTDTFVVHVSSFRQRQEALREVANLRNLGLTARIVPVILADRGRWERVVLGAYPDSLSAALDADRMRDLGLVPFAQILGRGGVGEALGIADR